MRVKINTTIYNVEFYHENKISIKTRCRITVDGMYFIRTGYATVNPKDNFCKEKGRKISLARALKECEFEKKDRTIFWNEYKKWGKVRF